MKKKKKTRQTSREITKENGLDWITNESFAAGRKVRARNVAFSPTTTTFFFFVFFSLSLSLNLFRMIVIIILCFIFIFLFCAVLIFRNEIKAMSCPSSLSFLQNFSHYHPVLWALLSYSRFFFLSLSLIPLFYFK